MLKLKISSKSGERGGSDGSRTCGGGVDGKLVMVVTICWLRLAMVNWF
jgi:hypothetical protein